MFHSVPIGEPNRGRWIHAIESHQPFDYIVQTYHVCSRHFLSTDIRTTGKRKMVISGRVPSIFSNLSHSNGTNGVEVEIVRAEENIQSAISQTPSNGIENDVLVRFATDEHETWYFDDTDFDFFGENDTGSCPNPNDSDDLQYANAN